jgi:hypothetical protein
MAGKAVYVSRLQSPVAQHFDRSTMPGMPEDPQPGISQAVPAAEGGRMTPGPSTIDVSRERINMSLLRSELTDEDRDFIRSQIGLIHGTFYTLWWSERLLKLLSLGETGGRQSLQANQRS